MKKPRIEFILGIQLVAAIFAVPYRYGVRNLFISDILFLLWPFFFWEEAKIVFRKKTFLIASGLLTLSFLHGYFRPDIMPAMLAQNYFILQETEHFKIGREGVLALRFLSWIFALFISVELGKKITVKQKKIIGLITIALLLMAVVLMIFEYQSAFFRNFVARVFVCNPYHEFWAGRVFGPFRSPIEAAAALGFGLVLLLNAKNLISHFLRIISFGFFVLGIYLTKTLTVLLSLPLLFTTKVLLKIKNKNLRNFGFVAIGLVSFVGIFALKSNPFIAAKINDLFFRVGPWSVYFSKAVSRLDHALLGFGFAPYHADNVVVFLFSRIGFLGLGLGIWFFYRFMKRADFTATAKVMMSLYFILVGMTFDLVVFRSSVAIVICSLIPIFSRSKVLATKKV